MSVEKNLKSRNRMKFFIVMAMLLGSSVASAENKQITSPDGKLVSNSLRYGWKTFLFC